METMSTWSGDFTVKISEGIFDDTWQEVKHFRVIGHGVNTAGVMGAGIAGQIAHRFPSIVPHYIDACRNGFLKPGGATILLDEPSGIFIANAASQDKPGKFAREEWMRESLLNVYRQICTHQFTLQQTTGSVPKFHVRIPLIGAGIGGISPERSADIIFDTVDKVKNIHSMMAGEKVTTTLYLRPGESHNKTVTEAFTRHYAEFPNGKYDTSSGKTTPL